MAKKSKKGDIEEDFLSGLEDGILGLGDQFAGKVAKYFFDSTEKIIIRTFDEVLASALENRGLSLTESSEQKEYVAALDESAKQLQDTLEKIKVNLSPLGIDLEDFSLALSEIARLNPVSSKSVYNAGLLGSQAFSSEKETEDFALFFSRLELISNKSISGTDDAVDLIKFMRGSGADIDILSGLAALDLGSYLTADDILEYAEKVRATFMSLGLDAEETLALSTAMQEQGVSESEAESLWLNFSKILKGAGDSFLTDGNVDDDNDTGNNTHLIDLAKIVLKRDSKEDVTDKDVEFVDALIDSNPYEFFAKFLEGFGGEDLSSTLVLDQLSHLGFKKEEVTILQRLSGSASVFRDTRREAGDVNALENAVAFEAAQESGGNALMVNSDLMTSLKLLPDKIIAALKSESEVSVDREINRIESYALREIDIVAQENGPLIYEEERLRQNTIALKNARRTPYSDARAPLLETKAEILKNIRLLKLESENNARKLDLLINKLAPLSLQKTISDNTNTWHDQKLLYGI